MVYGARSEKVDDLVASLAEIHALSIYRPGSGPAKPDDQLADVWLRFYCIFDPVMAQAEQLWHPGHKCRRI